MTTTVFEILDDLRASSARRAGQGDKFERLMQAYLRTDPEWSDPVLRRVAVVGVAGARRAARHRASTSSPQHRDRDGFAAIQCKFYDADAHGLQGRHRLLPVRVGRQEFTARYIFDTADDWTGNAEETLGHQAVPVQRVDIAYLDEAKIDWSQFSWSTPEVLVPTGHEALRPHQERALEDVRDGPRRARPGQADHGLRHRQDLHQPEDRRGAWSAPAGRCCSWCRRSSCCRSRCGSGWQEAEVDIRPFAVCSDVRVGRRVHRRRATCPPST